VLLFANAEIHADAEIPRGNTLLLRSPKLQMI